MAVLKTARTLVAAGTVQTAGAGNYRRGVVDLNAVQGGGFLTMKVTNGALAPSTQCEMRVLVAHSATPPAAASAGAEWKTIAVYGGGTGIGAITEIGMPIDPSVMCLEVEFNGNTGQNVTVEAYFSELTLAA